MKQILLKTWLVIACLLTGAGTAWAEDVVYKTALFGSKYNSDGVSSYSASWTATNNGFTVNLANWNNNNNTWDYIKAGNKSTAYVGTITTAAAIDKAVTKIVVTIDAITAANVNSIKLYSGDAADACTTEVGSFDKSTGKEAVTITSPTAGKFYKLAFDCIAKANGCVQVSKVEYYVNNGGTTPPATTYNVTVAENIANGSVKADKEKAAEKATVTLTATPADGYVFSAWDVKDASNNAITVTDNKFTMPASDVTVSATFEKEAEPEDKTIAEFIANKGGKCYLTGVVSNIKNTKYGNFDLTDASGTVYVYGCLTPEGEKEKFATLGIEEGVKIKVLANEYELYNGTTEEAKNVILVEKLPDERPEYTITWNVNGNLTTETLKEGETIEAPKIVAAGGKIFTGWVTSATVEAASAPEYVTPDEKATKDVTYYAVFAREGFANKGSLTKLDGESELKDGDEILVLAEKDSKYYMMVQETVSSSYVAYSDWNSIPGLSDLEDARTTWTLTAGEGGKWYMGDDTDGYLYNSSSNSLYASTTNKTAVTIAWDDKNEKFTIKNGDRWIACRADLTGGNQYKFRGAGTDASPTTGLAYFDLYRYVAPTRAYADFSTKVPELVAKTVALPAEEDGYYHATFSSNEVTFFPETTVVSAVGVDEKGQLKLYSYEEGFKMGAMVIDDKEVLGYYVPAYTGVLLLDDKEEATYYEVKDVTPELVTEGNMLRPASEEMEDGFKFYKLAYGNYAAKTGLGFYYGAEEGGTFTCKPGTAYLAVPESVEVKAFLLNGDMATGISTATKEAASAQAIYNLAGQRMNKLQRGINLVGGKKVLVF